MDMWKESRVGDEFASLRYCVTSEEVQRFSDAVEDHHPWYSSNSPFGESIVPPLFIGNDYGEILLKSNFFLEGAIHAKAEHEFFGPIRVGSMITVRARILDIYSKKGRDYMVVETITTDENGVKIAESRNTLMRAL